MPRAAPAHRHRPKTLRGRRPDRRAGRLRVAPVCATRRRARASVGRRAVFDRRANLRAPWPGRCRRHVRVDARRVARRHRAVDAARPDAREARWRCERRNGPAFGRTHRDCADMAGAHRARLRRHHSRRRSRIVDSRAPASRRCVRRRSRRRRARVGIAAGRLAHPVCVRRRLAGAASRHGVVPGRRSDRGARRDRPS